MSKRLTVPPFAGPLPEGWPLDPMKTVGTYVGETVDLPTRGLVGNFTFADVWAKRPKSADDENLFALPEAFKNMDWKKEVAGGDAKNGAALFAARGCAVCPSVKPGDAGGGGPALQGANSRIVHQCPKGSFKHLLSCAPCSHF